MEMARHLRCEGYIVGRKRIRRLMQKMGLCVVYQRARTTVPAADHERVLSEFQRSLHFTSLRPVTRT
jgi:hypothetical protein